MNKHPFPPLLSPRLSSLLESSLEQEEFSNCNTEEVGGSNMRDHVTHCIAHHAN
jgi:hypothetical protein